MRSNYPTPTAILKGPELRNYLLDHGLRFIRSAINLPGVQSVSLLGSITTNKPNPKDIDVLVVISDEMELERLALHGRRLKGAAQQLNSGADIFLADRAGNYLGRICQWKDCRPGKRSRCDAQNCGKRPHLHDDLQDVTLSPNLIQHPPVTLWPTVVHRIQLPADLDRMVEEFILSIGSRAKRSEPG